MKNLVTLTALVGLVACGSGAAEVNLYFRRRLCGWPWCHMEEHEGEEEGEEHDHEEGVEESHDDHDHD